jgi:hypothetical protein
VVPALIGNSCEGHVGRIGSTSKGSFDTELRKTKNEASQILGILPCGSLPWSKRRAGHFEEEETDMRPLEYQGCHDSTGLFGPMGRVNESIDSSEDAG